MERAEVKKEIEAAITQGKRTIVLVAPGGYGKSYIAGEYCDNSYYRRDGFIFANGDIRKQLKYLFETTYPNENARDDMQDGAFARYIYNRFDNQLIERADQTPSWVITYDDVAKNRTEFNEFIRQFKYAPRANAHGFVIITTKNCWGISDRNVAVVEVGRVEEETARAFLNEAICGISKEDVDKLLLATGRIALPLRIAGASIVNLSNWVNATISDRVTDFCNKVAKEDLIIPNYLDGYDRNLYGAIRVTVENILRYENSPGITYDLLMCSAMTAPVQFDRQTKFTSKLGISHWEQAHEAIVGWHLFETDDSFNMHPTTQDVLLYIDRHRDAASYYDRLYRVSKAFIELCGSDNSRKDGLILINAESSPSFSSEIESAKRIHGLLRKAVNETMAESNSSYLFLCEHLYALSYGIAYYYYKEVKYFKLSERYYKFAYDATEKILDMLHDNDTWLYRKTAQLKYRGVSLRGLDKNEQSLGCLDDALQLYMNVGKETEDPVWHKLAAEIYYNRGLTKSDKGNHQDVLDDYNESLKIVKEHSINDCPVPQRLLGMYYRDTGRYNEAETHFKDSLIIDEGGENAARCFSNLGLLYVMMKNWEQSKTDSRRAIEEFEKINIKTGYSPFLNLELCYRSQQDSQHAKECLLRASAIIFGDEHDAYAQQINAILDGRFKDVALNGKNYDRDNIACMLLCVHCAEYLISFSTNEGTNDVVKTLLDMAFEVREKSFRTLRGQLLELKGYSQDHINKKIREHISGLKYHKLTCAVLMFATAKYYLNMSDKEYAYIFACAAYHLYDAYNYEYGREKTKEFIDSLDIS